MEKLNLKDVAFRNDFLLKYNIQNFQPIVKELNVGLELYNQLGIEKATKEIMLELVYKGIGGTQERYSIMLNKELAKQTSFVKLLLGRSDKEIRNHIDEKVRPIAAAIRRAVETHSFTLRHSFYQELRWEDLQVVDGLAQVDEELIAGYHTVVVTEENKAIIEGLREIQNTYSKVNSLVRNGGFRNISQLTYEDENGELQINYENI